MADMICYQPRIIPEFLPSLLVLLLPGWLLLLFLPVAGICSVSAVPIRSVNLLSLFLRGLDKPIFYFTF